MKSKLIAAILAGSLSACSASGGAVPQTANSSATDYRIVSSGNTISIETTSNTTVLSMTHTSAGFSLTGQGGLRETIDIAQIGTGTVRLGDGNYITLTGSVAKEYSSTGTLLSSVRTTTSGQIEITAGGRTTLVAGTGFSQYRRDFTECQNLAAAWALLIAAEAAAVATADVPAALLAAAGAEEIVAQMKAAGCRG